VCDTLKTKMNEKEAGVDLFRTGLFNSRLLIDGYIIKLYKDK